ncbi:hypothetical protein [Nocardia sp. R6R-6]|uniref:hypothetical protein n=1 Tax=Nocardia sp. R6R-6 TaxID=3459303 RepID=UPI00403DA8C7
MMKLYARRRPAPIGRQSPPAARAPKPLAGAVELDADLLAFAAKAAASPAPVAAAAVAADLAEDLRVPLRDIADLAGVARPQPAVFDASDVAARTWTEPLTAAVSAASKALGRAPARMPTFEFEARRFDAGRHIGLCRTAIRSASKRLDNIAANAAARERLAERGVKLTRYKAVRR